MPESIEYKVSEKLDQIAKENSELFSNICRQITTVLCALAWAELFKENDNNGDNNIQIIIPTILVCIIYYVIELFQHFYSAIKTRDVLLKYKNRVNENIFKEVDTSMIKINSITYKLTWIKLFTLITIVILLFIYFGNKIHF